MGWMIYNRWNSPKTRAEEKREILSLLKSADPQAVTYEPVHVSKVGSFWVVAVKIIPHNAEQREHLAQSAYYLPDDDGTMTVCEIIKTQRESGEWGYKTMGETSGVYGNFDAVPVSLLSKLSRLRDGEMADYARKWRESILAAKKAYKPKIGDRIILQEPVPFSTGHALPVYLREFVVTQIPGRRGRNRRVYRPTEGGPHLVRLRPEHLRECVKAN